MGEKTNNIPAEWQAAVLDAIAQAQERRAAMEESGELLDMDGVLKEVYLQLLKQAQASNVEEFQHKAYVASAMRRIARWCLTLAKEYPPTHRKGYGTAGTEELARGNLIFKFGGGVTGGPPPGDGDAGWPEPEEVPEDELSGGWYTIEPPGDMVSFFHSQWDTWDIGGRSQELARHGAGEEEFRALQAGALFDMAKMWRSQGNSYLYLYPKDPGRTNYQGKAEDILLLRTSDGNIYWRDVGISFGSAAARLDFGEFRISGEPDKYVEP